jgi:hypothetical protein
MMHRARPIFRLLNSVTPPILDGNRGIMSTLQQRHPGSVDITPLHPISAAVRIALEQKHTTKTTCVHLHKVSPVWRTAIRLRSFSFYLSASFLGQVNLRDTLRACMFASYQPRMTTWAKRRRMREDRTQKFTDQSWGVLQSDVTRIAHRVIAESWPLINNDNIERECCFKQFRASFGIRWFVR